MAVIGDLKTILSVNSAPMTGGLQSAISGLTSFGASIGSVIPRMAMLAGGIVGVTSAVSALTSGLRSAMQMEQLEVAFGTLFGSAETAKQVLADLGKFAAETPFQMPELASAGKQLAAFGVEAQAIVPQLRMLGDLAAGIGAPIEDLAYLFGTTKVQGRMMAQDVNQFLNRGIPIIQEFAKQFGVTEAEVKKLVSEGRIGFPELQQALQSLTGEGGKFHGMMEAQSKTLAGLLSTLKDNFTAILRDISADLMAAFDLKAVLDNIIKGLQTIRPFVLTIARLVATTIEWLWALRPIAPVIAGVVVAMHAVTLAQKAIAAAQTIVLALSGPKGWAVLAAGAAIGVAAFAGVQRQFAAIEESARAATASVTGFNETLSAPVDDFADRLAESSANAADELAKVYDQIQLLAAPAHMKGIVEIDQAVAKIPGIDLLPDDQVDRLKNAMHTLRAMESRVKDQAEADAQLRQDQEDAQRRASAMLETIATPADKLLWRINEIQELFGRGLLNESEVAKLTKQAEQESGAIGGKGSPLGGVGALQRGSGEAFSAIMTAMRQEQDPQKKLLATAEQQLVAEQQSAASLKTIAANPPIQLVAGTV